MPEEPSPPKVAIVVVPGVGDHPAGEALDQIAVGLSAASGRYPWAREPDPGPLPVSVPAVRSSGGRGGREGGRYDAERRRLLRSDGAQIDLVEMRWSDLSSFPRNGLRAFFAAAFGLALQIGTAGMEATRPGRPRRTAANAAMNVASWWLATIVIPVTLVAALAGTALWLAVDEPLGVSDAVAVAAVVVVGLGATRALGAGIEAGGWVYPGRLALVSARRMTRLVAAAGLLVGVWRIAVAGSVEGGLGQTVLIAGGYGVRGAWLVAVALVAAAIVAILAGRDPDGRGAGPARRARFTALATTVVSPLLVALLGTILVGGIGAVAFTSAERATWGTSAGDLRCFRAPTDLTWTDECGTMPGGWPELAAAIGERLDDADALEARADDLRLRLLAGPAPGRALRPADRLEEEAGRIRDAAAAAEREVDTAPPVWATKVFESSMLPLVPIALLLALALGAAGAWLLLVKPLLQRRRRGGRNPPGTRLDNVLAGATGRAGAGAVAGLGLAGALLTAVFSLVVNPVDTPGWVPLPDWATDPPAAAWAGLSTLILGGLVVARLAPIDPRAHRENVGGWLERLRKGLDIPYDVATYLRIDDGSGVRSRIVARYRALLLRLDAERYTHYVFAAHSQGSMYTLATLFGDRHRAGPERPGSPWGVLPWDEWIADPSGSAIVARPVALLTFGCPIRQTYEERLPGQYGWTDLASPELPETTRILTGPWTNVYRPRDYIGRSVFRAPGAPPTNSAGGYGSHLVRAGRGTPLRLVDACLEGPGGHTGYFGDAELNLWLTSLVDHVLDGGEFAPPDGYAPWGPPDTE